MINKIYNTILEFIREEWKFLLFILVLCFINFFPVDYYIFTGGGTIEASKRVEVEGSKQKKGSINLAFVSELKGTISTYLLSYVIPSFDRVPATNYEFDNDDASDVNFRNRILIEQANNNAIYVAYTKAGKKIKEKKQGFFVYTIDKKADTDLEVGDQIIEVDGKKIKKFDDIVNSFDGFKNNDTISIKVKKNNKTKIKTAKLYEKDNDLALGIYLTDYSTYEVSPKLKFTYNKREGGSSGGLMMSLEIYNQLMKKDITKGKKIVGTGTIEKDGTVGEISGIKYKLKGAVEEKADIFIAPTGANYKEALKEKKKHNYKIKVIEAKNFDQVVDTLSKL